MVDDACEAALYCAFYVERRIINEDAFSSHQSKFLQKASIDPWFGLKQMLIGGNKLSVEKAKSRNIFSKAVETSAGVGQQIDAIPLTFKLFHQIINAIQRRYILMPLVQNILNCMVSTPI